MLAHSHQNHGDEKSDVDTNQILKREVDESGGATESEVGGLPQSKKPRIDSAEHEDDRASQELRPRWVLAPFPSSKEENKANDQ